VIRYLDDAAIGVDEIGLRRPTLDEVFLALTGNDAAAPATPHVTNGSSR
jgi:ABC-2 type transport system ATP-binding protein